MNVNEKPPHEAKHWLRVEVGSPLDEDYHVDYWTFEDTRAFEVFKREFDDANVAYIEGGNQ